MPRDPDSGMFAALHNRNYRLWASGQIVSLVGTRFVKVSRDGPASKLIRWTDVRVAKSWDAVEYAELRPDDDRLAPNLVSVSVLKDRNFFRPLA